MIFLDKERDNYVRTYKVIFFARLAFIHSVLILSKISVKIKKTKLVDLFQMTRIKFCELN